MLQHTLSVGVTVLSARLVYRHASDSDDCNSVEYYLIPLNFSPNMQPTRKFYSCELSRAPPRPPRRGAAATWILGERSQATSYVGVAIYESTWPWVTVRLHE